MAQFPPCSYQQFDLVLLSSKMSVVLVHLEFVLFQFRKVTKATIILAEKAETRLQTWKTF